MDTTLLLAFAGTFFLIAFSPGLCMTLSLSLGISIGVRRTLWMMWGELAGIALVGAAAMLGVAALLLASPEVFTAFKVVGAGYLLWSAWKSWTAPPPDLAGTTSVERTPQGLAAQGFITAVANPKAWAFNVALFPPFINASADLAPQMAALLAIMVVIEFTCLLIYAQGGRSLGNLLIRRGYGQWINRVAALMMVGVAAWLVLG